MKDINMNLEVIWWLDKGHNVPMDIIRFILSEWTCNEPIENNDKFRECIKLWFTDKNQKEEDKNNQVGQRNFIIWKYGQISDWNTKNISDMNGAFEMEKEFNEDISRWNVSNVTNMNYMFFYCFKFNCDISQWNVKKVKEFRFMFYNCKSFNCDISNWNIKYVIYFLSIFDGCDKLSYLPKIKDQWVHINPCIKL